MSLLRKPKARKVTKVASAWERLWSAFSPAEGRGRKDHKPRHLVIDALEERTLLSVSAASIESKLLATTAGVTGMHMAEDSKGDFVVVWSANDTYANTNGGYGGTNGGTVTASNIYAEYLTDEVQRIVLPQAVLSSTPGKYGSVSITYGGDTVQELTISPTTSSNFDPQIGVPKNAADTISGTFELAYTASGGTTCISAPIQFNEDSFTDRNWASTLAAPVTTTTATTLTIADANLAIDGSYVIQVGTERMLVTKTAAGTLTVTRGYDNTTATTHSLADPVTIVSNDTLIQEALRALATTYAGSLSATEVAALSAVTVTAIDSQHYTLDFNDNNPATNLSVKQLAVTAAAWGTGFLPAAQVSTVSGPITISGIKVSPTNPALTALSIVDAFNQQSTAFYTASNTGIATVTVPGVAGIATPLPTIVVTSVPTAADPKGLCTFNIEFTGEAACTIVPLLNVSTWDATGAAITTPTTVSVVQQNTGIFRVNPPQLDNPFTQERDVFNQTGPSVAMDAAGDFVVTWEGQVSNYDNPGSVSDIFARQYGTGGSMTILGDDGVTQSTVTGVHLVQAYAPYSATLADDDPFKVASDLYTFRANVATANAQIDPSVGMDAAGNFTIAWADTGQPVSYFNGIYMRQFAADGSPDDTADVMVSDEDTTVRDDPYVVTSADGHTLILWVNETYGEIYSKLFDATGTALSLQTDVAPGSGASACFDTNDNIAISFTVYGDVDYTGLPSNGVYLVESSLAAYPTYAPAMVPVYIGADIRPLTRINGADTWPDAPTWPNDQVGGQVVMDADGDLTVAYSGFGPDTNGDLALTQSQNTSLQTLLTAYANESGTGLTAAQITWLKSGKITLPYNSTTGTNHTIPGDIDSEIDEILMNAMQTVANKGYGFNATQAGCLRGILEEIADLARGDANAVMYTQSDADPTIQSTILDTDQIVNSQRDGNNAQFIISVGETAPLSSNGTGTIEVDITDLLTGYTLPGAAVQVTLTPVYGDPNNPTTITSYTVPDVLGAIEASLAANPYCLGANLCFTVRELTAQELAARAGTDWDLQKTQVPNKTYVYEVTFMGQLHDTPLVLQVTPGGGFTAVSAAYAQSSSPVPGSSGSVGTPQYDAQIGITPEGNFTITYLQDNLDGAGNVTSTSIYYRVYNESTDTAGPTVTDVSLVSTSGEKADLNISNTATMQNSAAYAVVSVSKALYDSLAHSGNAASNPANYVLLDANGNPIAGAISAVYFGLDEAATLAVYGSPNGGDFSALSSTPSGRYEIVIVFNDGGTGGTVTPLTTGTYTLTIKAPATNSTGITDVAGVPLGYTGYTAQNGNGGGVNYSLKFSLAVTSDTTGGKTGTEILVNQTTTGVQTTESTGTNVNGYSANTRTIACDDDGEFVVVWLQYESDGTTDVYMRLYNKIGNPLTNETMVNTYTAGDQTEVSVAMDAVGDFVVVWASQDQDPDGSWGIYGQRFNAVGTKIGGEFRVNTKTGNDQVSPSVAMDSKGDFVVVWATQGQSSGNFNGIDGQVFDSGGNELGSEFAVNSQNVGSCGTTASNNTLHPEIAMGDIGTFVVVWTAVTTQANGVATNSVIMGRMFTWDSTGATPMLVTTTVNGQSANSNTEFQVSVGDNTFIADAQALANDRLAASPFFASNAAVAMNSSGQFVVTWEAFQDNDQIDSPTDVVNSYGIYYRQFTAGGQAKTPMDEQANQVVTALDTTIFYSLAQSALYAGDQVRSSVSMDTDGNFTITWDGNGSSTTDTTNPQDLAAAFDQDSQGVWVRSFQSTALGATTNPATSTESRVNSTSLGIQDCASVAMTADGGYIVDWSGKGTGDSQGVFFKIYPSTTDTDGPIVADATLVTTAGNTLDLNVSTANQTSTPISYIVLDVDEALYDSLTKTGNAASNPANYVLDDSTGTAIPGGISAVYYGLNEVSALSSTIPVLNPTPSGKYEIVIAVNVSGAPLPTGTYTLKLLTPINPSLNNPAGKPGITDLVGNKLNATAANPAGSNYSITFSLSISGGNPTTKYGTEVLVNQTIAGVQTTSSTGLNVAGDPAVDRCVASDDAGDFVVVWIQYESNNTTDVFMRLYDNTGNPLTNEEMVNTYTTGNQTEPSVAMDADGDYVIVWASQGQDPDGSWGIYGQRFNSMGSTVGDEFRVNTNTANDQVSPDVAMDSQGDFIVVWATQGQSYSYFNTIKGQIYGYNGSKLGGEFAVNSQNIPGTGLTASNNQLHPSIAMSQSPLSGSPATFMVVWTAVTSQFNGVATGSVIKGRDFTWNSAGATPMTIQGSNTEFQVSVGSAGYIPSDPEDYVPLPATGLMASNAQVAMDRAGNAVVAWEAFQDNDILDQPTDVVNTYGIYFRAFNPDGTAKTPVDEHANELVHVLDPTQNPLYTWPQDEAFYGNQMHPAVSMDADGDFAIAWDGPGTDTTDPATVSDVAAQFNQDQSGVWVRQFHSIPNGYMALPAVKEEVRVNDTSLGVQESPSLAMASNGTFVTVWSGNGIGDSQGVFFKIYKEPTDTAGPIVTGFELPDGTPISNTSVAAAIQAVIITFDEALDPTTAVNLNNYALVCNGAQVNGALAAAYYTGRDTATNPLVLTDIASKYPGVTLSVGATNKYEVVLIFSSALVSGNYQIVVRNSIRDVAGNALYTTGSSVNGAVVSGSLTIIVPTNTETTISTNATLTYNTADAVASDAKGDSVAVWAGTTANNAGVWAGIYDQTTTANADGTQSTSFALIKQFQVSTDTTATDASVAVDKDGDFVVTWSGFNTVGFNSNDWDVYAETFYANGNIHTGTFMVNTTTLGTQRSSSVAMDVRGDFVITWESRTAITSSTGYDIDAEEFSAAGNVLNGTDDEQSIVFDPAFSGSFRIRWDDDNNPNTPDKVTGLISVSQQGAFAAAADVQAALQAIGADVTVTAASATKLVVTFVGTDTCRDVSLLWVSPADVIATTGNASTAVTIALIVDGASGQFVVNDTLAGDQMYPDIAMSDDGSFVITWTSYGQDGDLPTDGNIYAKNYSNYWLSWTDSQTPLPTPVPPGTVANPDPGIEELCTTVDSPDNHEVSSSDHQGVVKVENVNEGSYGSGSLLAGTDWVLTAGHVVCYENSNIAYQPGDYTVWFDTPNGRIGEAVTQIVVCPTFDGNPLDGGDIAMVKLANVPEGVTGYQLYTSPDALNQVYQEYGYGAIGLMSVGYGPNVKDIKHTGENEFEVTGTMLGAYLGEYVAPSILLADADSGSPAQDAFGQMFGINNLGLGINEACAAPGDSGGPAFVDGEIAGTADFIMSSPADIDAPKIDATYGEIIGWVNVLSFASWINSVSASSGTEYLVNSNDVGIDPATGNQLTIDNQSDNQSHSSVAMDALGDYTIVWTSYGHDGGSGLNGASYNGENGVFAKRFSANGSAKSISFQVNQTTAGNQQDAHVAMDANGDFAVAWESNSGSGYDIYARRYVSTATAEYQQNVLNPNLPFFMPFATNPLYGLNGENGGEFLVNSTTAGDQRYPSVGMDDTGDIIVVWSGQGQSTNQGVFYQRYAQVTHDAPPTVTDVDYVDGNSGSIDQLRNGDTIAGTASVTQLVVTLGENVSTAGGAVGTNSILNPANWSLSQNGTTLAHAIVGVQYGLNECYVLGLSSTPSNKYEAVVTFDTDPATAGNQPLAGGQYVLTLSDNVEDQFGTKLDGNYDGAANGVFTLTFSVQTSSSSVNVTTDDVQTTQDCGRCVAMSDDGGYVVAWVSYSNGQADVYVRLYNEDGTPRTGEILVTDSTYDKTTNQLQCAVAMDADGDFVVTWASEGQDPDGSWGIYARRFSAMGVALGSEFRVNTNTANDQTSPSVAMDSFGDFIIVWETKGQTFSYLDDVKGQLFDAQGNRLGGEFMVNAVDIPDASGTEIAPSVAMSDIGTFVVTWTRDVTQTDGVATNSVVVDRLFDWSTAGAFPATGEAEVDVGSNAFISDPQAIAKLAATQFWAFDSQVAMNKAGEFIITWVSHQDNDVVNPNGTDVPDSYGIYYRVFNLDGTAQTTVDCQANQVITTGDGTYTQAQSDAYAGNQLHPSVSMDADGDFTITWDGNGSNAMNGDPTKYTGTDDQGIWVRTFHATQTGYTTDPATSTEFREQHDCRRPIVSVRRRESRRRLRCRLVRYG